MDGIARITSACGLRNIIYVGLGSVWFTDFVMAHRDLGVKDMHSIELDPIIAARARYNRPFRTLRVHEGASDTVLPQLLQRNTYLRRPWIVWLDYDDHLRRSHLLELARLVRDLPEDSFLLTTFSAQPSRYGKLVERSMRLGEVLGQALDPEPEHSQLRESDKFMMLLGQLVEDHLRSSAIRQGRPGGYLPAFRMGYRDGSPMTTVGGFLSAPENLDKVKAILNGAGWVGRPDKPITTAPLTAKEVSALQSKLPARRRLTRADVQRLGFDLDEDQIELFEEYYLSYPTFAQVAM